MFFWEGLLKFAYVNQGIGRFTKLGMPTPGVLAPAIAVLEIGGGLLVMSGLATRFISVPFIIEMIVAILATKVLLYLGTLPLPAPPAPPRVGAWAGPGPWSLDALLQLRRLSQTRTSALAGQVMAQAASR